VLWDTKQENKSGNISMLTSCQKQPYDARGYGYSMERSSGALVSLALRYVFPKNAFERDIDASMVFKQQYPFPEHSTSDPLPSESFAFPEAPQEPHMSQAAGQRMPVMMEQEPYPSTMLSSIIDETDWMFLSSLHPFSSAVLSESYEENCRQLAPLPPLFAPSPPRPSPPFT
jgi:hypothetical protein